MNIGCTGASGEKLAAKLLEKKGYKILCRNYQTRFGEVDIVCRDGNYIVFAEVKTRSGNYMVSGREAVTYSKQSKLIKTALQYIQSHHCELQPRFDVVEVIANGDSFELEHIENAFSAGGRHEFF